MTSLWVVSTPGTGCYRNLMAHSVAWLSKSAHSLWKDLWERVRSRAAISKPTHMRALPVLGSWMSSKGKRQTLTERCCVKRPGRGGLRKDHFRLGSYICTYIHIYEQILFLKVHMLSAPGWPHTCSSLTDVSQRTCLMKRQLFLVRHLGLALRYIGRKN